MTFGRVRPFFWLWSLRGNSAQNRWLFFFPKPASQPFLCLPLETFLLKKPTNWLQKAQSPIVQLWPFANHFHLLESILALWNPFSPLGNHFGLLETIFGSLEAILGSLETIFAFGNYFGLSEYLAPSQTIFSVLEPFMGLLEATLS